LDFLKRIKNEILIIDGATGTLLLDKGVKPGAPLEELNVSNPDLIRSIHKSYVDAGADIIETNNFGGNRVKLSESGLQDKVRELNSQGVILAKEAAGGKALVAGNIGPTGKLLRPMGEISFDEAYDAFAEQAKIIEEAGADLISVETMTDILELKAAVMAARENTKLPVIAQMTFEDNGIAVTGTPPEAFVLIAESAGADVIGANCSNGPEILLPVMKKIAKHATKPLVVMPNAGFPELVDDRAIYKMTPEVFAQFSEKFIKMGVNIIGGCCGTRPEHIRELVNRKSKIVNREIVPLRGFASRTRVVLYSGKTLVIGERINPTGKKYLQDEIRSGGTSIIKEEASGQERAGADLIDVNVGVPETDDVVSMQRAVEAIGSSTQIPISIDSPKASVLESGLKAFVGKPLVNSTTGKESSLSKVLPLVKRFGAAVIGLCLDDSGIPKTPEDRLAVAKNIVNRAISLGISKEDIFIDTLVMTAGIGVEESLVTLRAAKLVKDKLEVKTVLGISNVSHGMPSRSKLNEIYLKLALLHGLDAAIVDPTDKQLMKAFKDVKAVKNKDKAITKLISDFRVECERWRGKKGKVGVPEGKKRAKVGKASLPEIKKAVIGGDADRVRVLSEKLLKQGSSPQGIIDKALVPAMEVVGRRFSSGKYFLPQVISSAEAMRAGFELAKRKIKKGSRKSAGTVVLATVRGDIHDIGKNIVRMMLENNGFRVVDLGKDVPPEKVVGAVRDEKADAVALSALLTTTMPEMKVVKEDLAKQGIDVPVIIGGAVVTSDYAGRIGAAYGKDAVSAVGLAKGIIKNIRRR
jgi:5-methyltetrahydrofolate--homocysteine methyltransferase